eukprot:48597_1
MSQVKIAICVAILCIYWLIWTPMLIYNIYQFYSKSNEILIQKRNPKLTCLHSIVSLIGFAFYGSIYLLYSSQFNSTISKITNKTMNITFPLIAYSFVWGVVFKYYLLCFEINWIKAMHTNAWKEQINKSENMTNFFLVYKNSYGSIKFALTVVLIILILSIAIYWIVIIIFGDITVIFSIVNLLMTLIPTLLTATFWYMTPNIFDKFDIVIECRILIIFGAIYILSYLCVAISPLFGATAYTRQITGNIVGSTAYFVVGMFELSFSLRKLRLSKHENDLKRYIEHHAAGSIQEKHHNIHKSMADIMSDSDLFDIFMDHLRKEFSLEMGLAYIEFVQYKRLIDIKLFPQQNKMIECKEQICIINNEEIPKSFIVYSDVNDVNIEQLNKQQLNILSLEDDKNDSLNYRNDLSQYQLKAFLLYNKYIRVNSDFEINIPFMIRKQLAVQMDEIDEWLDMDTDINRNDQLLKLLGLFESVTKEQYSLLRCAFTRFKGTAVYKKLRTQKTK